MYGMQTYYAIKRPNAWLWSEKLTREDVLSKVASCKITLDWSICPLGEARHAVRIRDFVSDPEIFSRAQQQEIDRQTQKQNDLKAIEKAMKKSRLLVLHDRLGPAVFVVLVVASIFTKVFFFQLANKDPIVKEFGSYLVIVFWTLMSIAIVALILGKMLMRHRAKKIYEEQNRKF